MSHTIDELRRTLDEHSAAPPLTGSMRADVERRIRRVRRRRAAIGTTFAVAAVAVAVGVAMPGMTHTPTPSTSGNVHPGPAAAVQPFFAQFTNGGKLTASSRFDAAVRHSTTTTFVVKSLDTYVMTHCSANLPRNVSVWVGVNGQNLGFGDCDGGFTSRNIWAAAGAHLGDRVSLTLRLTTDMDPNTRTLPATRHLGHLWVGVAAYTPVPRSDYPFPPRPAHLQHLNVGGGVVVADQAHNHPVDAVVRRSTDFDVSMIAPGSVTVYCNGKPWQTFSA